MVYKLIILLILTGNRNRFKVLTMPVYCDDSKMFCRLFYEIKFVFFVTPALLVDEDLRQFFDIFADGARKQFALTDLPFSSNLQYFMLFTAKICF